MQDIETARVQQREPKPILLEMDEAAKSLSNSDAEEDNDDEPNNSDLIIPVAWVRNAVAVCVAVVAFLLFPSTVTEGEVNTVSHSVVDTGLLTSVMPKEMIKGTESIAEIKAPAPSVAKQTAPKCEQTKPTEAKHANQTFYCLVLASKITKRNANRYAQMLKDKGYDKTEVLVDDKDVKVTYGRYTRYQEGQSLFFQCPDCGKEFGIRIGVSKLHNRQKETNADELDCKDHCGTLTVIENVFHYKQVLPLRMGRNVIGRYMKNSGINCPIETNDPSIDMNHCAIEVSRDKRGRLKYVLSDGPSYTGTFVDNEILGDRERRLLENGSLFTIGATSIILRTLDEED